MWFWNAFSNPILLIGIFTSDDKSTLVQYWLGAVKQKAITKANVDLNICRHMVLLNHNALNPSTQRYN